MNNQLYSAKHIRRMKLFERQNLKAIFNALHEQIKPVVATLRSHGVDAAMKSIDVIHINKHLAHPIQEIYKDVGLYFANKTIHDLNQSVKEVKAGFGFNEEFLRAILNYFAQFLLNKVILPISETTKNQILAILTEGMKNGWGAEKIATQLESPELLLWRARLIVRTESNKAMNYGQLLGESKSEWESTKKWIAANDHRTRHSHRFIDDTVVDFKERFHVPIYQSIGGIRGKKKGIEMQTGYDYMTGPGDPHASAGNVCNCRCTISFAAKRDANGRLVRKASAPVLVN
jgi:uncharacterized protein with gpF-like domain